MTAEEFDSFLGESLDELEAKQNSLQSRFNLGEHNRFVIDYEACTLTFFENEAPRAEAVILPVSTHVPSKQSLRWSWANGSLPLEARRLASQVKELLDVTGFEVFANETVECDESMAWEMTAMACKVLAAEGAYRVPHAGLHAHVLLKSVRRLG